MMAKNSLMKTLVPSSPAESDESNQRPSGAMSREWRK